MTSYRNDNDFARALRDARSRTPYSQTEAAELIGLNRGYYSGLESGSQTTRSAQTIERIAAFYGLDPQELQRLAPETNIRTATRRAQRAKHGPPRVRKAHRLTEQELSPADAAPYISAAERLAVDPDDLFLSFGAIPPDILAWLKADRAHVKQVRELMETE